MSEAPKDGLADLPPLRDVLAAHGILANKGFGQHFLLDLNVTRKIARLAGPLDGCVTIEVGPGPGGLTRALLEAGARVAAVEKDPRFLPLLADLSAAAPGRLTVIEADALQVDERALANAIEPGAPVYQQDPGPRAGPCLVAEQHTAERGVLVAIGPVEGGDVTGGSLCVHARDLNCHLLE